MDGLDFPFKIEIDGKTIAEVDSGDSGPTQAALGSNAAVFKLQDSRLISGDWILARNKSEDRSLLPKQVLWFKLGTETEERAQPVSAHKDGDKYQVKFAGASLLGEEGKVFVELMGDGQPHTIIKV